MSQCLLGSLYRSLAYILPLYYVLVRPQNSELGPVPSCDCSPVFPAPAKQASTVLHNDTQDSPPLSTTNMALKSGIYAITRFSTISSTCCITGFVSDFVGVHRTGSPVKPGAFTISDHHRLGLDESAVRCNRRNRAQSTLRPTYTSDIHREVERKGDRVPSSSLFGKTAAW